MAKSKQYPKFDQDTGMYQHVMGGILQWSEQSNRHLAVLDALGWQREDRKHVGISKAHIVINRHSYAPSPLLYGYHPEVSEWKVVRLRPRNTEYKWAVITTCPVNNRTLHWPDFTWEHLGNKPQPHPRSGESRWQALRARQTGKLRLFKTPANAIIAAEEEMRKRYALLASSGFRKAA